MIVLEVNMRKEKALFVDSYKPPLLKNQSPVDTLSDLLVFVLTIMITML